MIAGCLRFLGVVLLLMVVGSSGIASARGNAIKGAIFALTSSQHTQSLSSSLMSKIKGIVGGTDIMDELEELLEGGYLQEVIWRLQDTGYASKAANLEQLLSDILAYEEIVSIDKQLRSRGYNLLYVVRFANGVQVVLKHARRSVMGSGKEAMAYRFDKLLGLNVFPLTVMKELDRNYVAKEFGVGASGVGAMQLFMPRAVDADEIAGLVALKRNLAVSEDKSAFAAVQDIAELDSSHPAKSNYKPFVPPMPKKVRTLKFLTRDRDASHGGNYMFPLRGRNFTIDGDKAFEIETRYFPPSIERSYVNKLRESPQDYFSDADFLSRLEKITLNQIEEALYPVFAKYTESIEDVWFKEVCASLKERIDLYIRVVGKE